MTARKQATAKPDRKPGRDVNAELKAYLGELESGTAPAPRTTTFTRKASGAIERKITAGSGRVVARQTLTTASSARMQSGMSQSQFAALLGVSVRTLQEWEQGRKEPSGAAKTLLTIATQNPKALRDAAKA
jgi:putative transcriptional regulator